MLTVLHSFVRFIAEQWIAPTLKVDFPGTREGTLVGASSKGVNVARLSKGSTYSDDADSEKRAQEDHHKSSECSDVSKRAFRTNDMPPGGIEPVFPLRNTCLIHHKPGTITIDP
ncbi:hypothetical protein C8R44DRAFT_741516 [Mycena epipterygia]|nr:hypothetical protein C8R44DRAFT_741516 [Mycena epipterygia]